MLLIEARNPHGALPLGLALLRGIGVQEDSRNGPVLRAPEPVTTVYRRPLERLVFHEWRDSNPFFLNVEALWMLAGRDDLKQLTPFVANMKDYSDDGGLTQPGAYGKRWRNWFWDPEGGSHDQLDWVVERLRNNSSDRRTVIQMWDPTRDIHAADNGGADVPCNLTILPWVGSGALHLTIFNRSNDILWGLYSANACQFATLAEYLAGRLALPVGTLTTVSNNFHAYLDKMPEVGVVNSPDPYDNGFVEPPTSLYYGDFELDHRLDEDWLGNDNREEMVQQDLRIFFEHGAVESSTKARWPYLRHVTVPLVLAHRHWKNTKDKKDRYYGAMEILERCRASDWRTAAQLWVKRRQLAWMRAHDDGPAYEPALPMGQP